MKQLRFKVTVAKTFFFGLYEAAKADKMLRNRERYTDAERYALAMKICDRMRRTSRTETVSFGQELLPQQGGYLLISNHQGKYDALGVCLTHPTPITVLWEKRSARYILAKQVSGLLDCPIIDFDQPRKWPEVLRKVTKIAQDGGRILIFPEGGYADNGNRLQSFHNGCFRCALESKAPIVPVVLYDSYRAMDTNTFEPVVTQVHYLPPIEYPAYAGLKRYEICELVRSRIADKLAQLAQETKTCTVSN